MAGVSLSKLPCRQRFTQEGLEAILHEGATDAEIEAQIRSPRYWTYIVRLPDGPRGRFRQTCERSAARLAELTIFFVSTSDGRWGAGASCYGRPSSKALPPEKHEGGFNMKTGEPLPKNSAGSLHLEFKRCGRPSCRCRLGFLHGPYIYRHWRERGLQRKAYVPMQRLAEVLRTLEENRAAAARPGQVLQMLKDCHNV